MFGATPALDFGLALGFVSKAVGDNPGNLITDGQWLAISFSLSTVPVGAYNEHHLITFSAELNSGLPIGIYAVALDNTVVSDEQLSKVPILSTYFTVNVVPEPSSVLLLGAGLLGCVVCRRLRRRRDRAA